jgi:hypothetical protein
MFPSHSYLKQGLSKNEFNPGVFHKTVSQYDLPSFGLDPDAPVFIQQGYGPGGLPLNVYRGNSRRDHLMSENVERYRPQSLGSLNRGDSVSMLSERYTTSTDTLSLDRRIHGYRAQSMGAINMGYASDGEGRSMGGRVGSKQSLGQISGVSEGPDKYRDIAL